MLVQWCLKGLAQSDAFGDDAAAEVLKTKGLSSAWSRAHENARFLLTTESANGILSSAALDAHVNGFGTAQFNTPYISLSAGVVTVDPVTGATTRHSALRTAVKFATGEIWNGRPRHAGYVFRLWILVTPKPAPELPGFGEEVRDLNCFDQFGLYNSEGEVAAKLAVPHRQIQQVTKYNPDGTVDATVEWNRFDLNSDSDGAGSFPSEFISPERVTNLRELV
jgi:hypothetical protein